MDSGGMILLTSWQSPQVLSIFSASTSTPGHQTFCQRRCFVWTILGWPSCDALKILCLSGSGGTIRHLLIRAPSITLSLSLRQIFWDSCLASHWISMTFVSLVFVLHALILVWSLSGRRSDATWTAVAWNTWCDDPKLVAYTSTWFFGRSAAGGGSLRSRRQDYERDKVGRRDKFCDWKWAILLLL